MEYLGSFMLGVVKSCVNGGCTKTVLYKKCDVKEVLYKKWIRRNVCCTKGELYNVAGSKQRHHASGGF